MVYVLADNQDLTRLGLETICRSIAGSEVKEVDSRARLVKLLETLEGRTVVVLDLALFDFQDGVQLILVSQRFGRVHWVLLSDDLSDELCHQLTTASHSFSIVAKSSDLAEIDQAMRLAASGERFIGRSIMERLLAPARKINLEEDLTKTEIEILREIALGKTTKQIAIDRCSSFHTVNTHRKNIFRKLDINTAYEATKYAVRVGLVDLADYYI